MATERLPKGRTGWTDQGHTRDVKVDRLGHVTIHKRGKSYCLYYHENGHSIRRRVDANLNTARAMASGANQAIEEARPSPFAYRRIDIPTLISEYLDYCQHVQGLAIRTLDRYRAALSHPVRFARTTNWSYNGRPGGTGDR